MQFVTLKFYSFQTGKTKFSVTW